MSAVLVVEDTPSVAKEMEAMFRFHGHKVEIATSAAEASRILATQIFQAIITDGLDGDWTKVIEAGTLKQIGLLYVLSSSDLAEAVCAYPGVKFISKSNSLESIDAMLALLSNIILFSLFITTIFVMLISYEVCD